MKLRSLILTARIGRSRMTEWKLEGDRFQINRKQYLLTIGVVNRWSGLLWEANSQSVEEFEQRPSQPCGSCDSCSVTSRVSLTPVVYCSMKIFYWMPKLQLILSFLLIFKLVCFNILNANLVFKALAQLLTSSTF